MKQYLVRGGESIKETDRKMIDLARLTNETVKASFNGITLKAVSDMEYGSIEDKYQKLIQEKYIKYRNSAEFKKAREQALEAERKSREILEASLAEYPEEMAIRDIDAYLNALEIQKSDYAKVIIRTARNWARLMQGQMDRGRSLEDCAEETYEIANVDGLTGFMYGLAASFLSDFWVYGKEFREWYNEDTQIGIEGHIATILGKTLNPAVLIIST